MSEPPSLSLDLKVSLSGSSMGRSRVMIWVMGEKKRGVVVGGNGVEESSRMKMVEVWKGGELKRVEEREASVAEKR